MIYDECKEVLLNRRKWVLQFSKLDNCFKTYSSFSQNYYRVENFHGYIQRIVTMKS